MEDLTTGSVSRHLLKTTSFMLVTMVFQTLYFLIDLYWVGHLGKEAVAAVGLAGNLMFIVLAASQMLGVGTTTLVSHAAGRKEHDRALLVTNQSLVLAAVVGVLFLVFGMAFRVRYAADLSADVSTATQTAEYLQWFIPALALQFGVVTMAAALRGTGNFKPGMIVQTGTLIINMVLAPFLIFGWGTGHPLGVAGAAIATFVAVVVGSVWLSFYFLPRDAYLRFVPADWKPQFPLWKQILTIGLPAGAEFGLMTVYLIVVYAISRPFGAAAQAGFGVGMRIIQALFMPAVALAFSVAPVAGQNFGARRSDRVRDTFIAALVMSTGLMLLLTLLCHIAPAAMISVFSSDPQVIAVGEQFLRIISWNFVASGIVFIASSMFQAMGNTWPSLIASFVRILVVAVPAIVLSRMPGFELRWIWYLSVASVTLQVTLSLLLLRREYTRRLNFAAVPEATPAPVPAG
jgi:putative MATE family efflux protein